MRTPRPATLLALGLLALSPAAAQTSASYKLTEGTIDNGGNPVNGARPAAAHFHVTLDAIGDGVARAGLGSASFHMDGGFVDRYPPPGEVTGLIFGDPTTLRWNARPAADRYEIYRGTIASLPGTFGSCFLGNLSGVSAPDAAVPAAGQGFFYLVTARNRLREEGPKGYDSNGALEGNPFPCP